MQLWKYSLMHRNRQALGEWLLHCDNFIDLLGATTNSKILPLDKEDQVCAVPRAASAQRVPLSSRCAAQFRYQHLEYSPVVNARAHALGGASRQVEPAVVVKQYGALLRSLKLKAQADFSTADLLALTYYLLLQVCVCVRWGGRCEWLC